MLERMMAGYAYKFLQVETEKLEKTLERKDLSEYERPHLKMLLEQYNDDMITIEESGWLD